MDKTGIMLLITLIIVLTPVLAGCMDDDMNVGVGDGFTFKMDSMTRDLGEFDVRISLQVTISNEMDMDLSISHTYLVMTTSFGEELVSDLQIINKINITGNDDLPPSRTVRTSAIFRLDYDRIPLSLYLNYSDWGESGYTTVFSNDLELPEDFLLGEMVQYSPGNRPAYTIHHLSRPMDIVMADLDHDGLDDLVLADFEGEIDDVDRVWVKDQSRGISDQIRKGVIHVFLMDKVTGSPTICWSGSFGRGPHCIEISEVTGDEHPDIIVASWNSNDVRIIEGYGNGSFSDVEYEIIPLMTQPFDLEVADLNLDGSNDIVVMGGHSSIGDGYGDTVSILFSDPFHKYSTLEPINLTGMDGGLEVCDLNNDDLLDVVAGNRLHYQQRNGTFTKDPQMSFDALGSPVSGDLDGDGLVDLLLGDTIFMNDGVMGMDVVADLDLSYDISQPEDSSSRKDRIPSEISDMNGDGRPDLIIGSSIHLQRNDGSYSPAGDINLYVGQYDPTGWIMSNGLCTGDLNKDGLTDIAYIYKDGTDYEIPIFFQGGCWCN